jgi:hypothetical protein
VIFEGLDDGRREEGVGSTAVRGRALVNPLVDLLRVLDALLREFIEVLELEELVRRVSIEYMLVYGDKVFAVELRGEIRQ